jgi:ATP-dependent exoDNAse (exonuclease V) alpha subunit
VQRSDGTETFFPLGQGSALCDVGEKRKLKVAAGDKLLLQANAVAVRKHFVNGERVEVKRLAGEAIILTDGRTIPADYRTFTHGYAVTSHAAQGKTVDEVLVVASSRSLPAINQEQFYVSISRGRERCQIFTDDSDLLRSHVTRSSARLAAVEAMPQRDFLQTILQRGNRFLKRFRQRIAQSLSIETTKKSSHEIKPTEHQRTTTRRISV